MTTGDKIKLHRKQLNLTQTELGIKLGVKKNAVSKWECGRIDDIPTSKIKQLAELFNVTPSYLVGFDSDIPQQDYTTLTNVMPLPDTKKLPLLGDIACGAPILAENNISDYIDVDSSIKADFVLRCKGDSMINARIYDGDLVYIHIQPSVDSGEIAAVRIDDEATLKRVKMYEDKIVLEPENPQYRPLVFWGDDMNEVHIIGKAVAFTSLVR